MYKDENFKFKVSISREGYEDKETVKMCLTQARAKELGKQKLCFREQEVTASEFLGYAVKGYAFCNLFEFDENKKYWIRSGLHRAKVSPVYKRGLNKGYFKLNFKSDEFFKGSQTIFVDVDFTKYNDIKDYLKCLKYIPTCVYTSYNDNVNKLGVVSRRFRLVYVFDRVLNKEQFKDATFHLYETIVSDTQEPMYDVCGCSPSQYMNGSLGKEAYISNIIYSFDDLGIVTPLEKNNAAEGKTEGFTKELVRDMEALPYEFVVRKWFAKGLRYVTRTQIEFNSYYATTTDDYVSLYYMPQKIKDGEHRRKKLYIRASLRRLVKDNFTADELLYNLYIDREKFFDNSDNVITIDVLKNKVNAALATDIDVIREMAEGYKKPTFVINDEVGNKREAVAKARTEITDNKIGLLYDTSKTVSDNIKLMYESGYNVSRSRLYKWCVDYSVKTVKQKKAVLEGYNPKLSIRENMKIMNCTMYQVQKAKADYYK